MKILKKKIWLKNSKFLWWGYQKKKNFFCFKCIKTHQKVLKTCYLEKKNLKIFQSKKISKKKKNLKYVKKLRKRIKNTFFHFLTQNENFDFFFHKWPLSWNLIKSRPPIGGISLKNDYLNTILKAILETLEWLSGRAGPGRPFEFYMIWL